MKIRVVFYGIALVLGIVACVMLYAVIKIIGPNLTSLVILPKACSSYHVDACPARCAVCPPCHVCSSIGCQTKEFCTRNGFDNDWWNRVRPQPTGLPLPDTSCRLLTCHGLNIKCGTGEPLMCTMEYQLGDKCLQYAQCGIVNGVCSEIKNQAFENCKSCTQKCASAYPSDAQKQFACEQTCL